MIENNVEKRKSNSLIKKMHLFLAIFILLWLNVGAFSSYIFTYIPTIVKLSLYMIWLCIAIMYNKKYTVKLIKITAPLLMFFIIMIVSLIDNNNNIVNMYLNNILYILIITSILIYYWEDDMYNRKIILYILLIDTIYVGINTLINLNENELLSRMLATSKEMQIESLDGINYKAVGSFSYFYSLVMILLVIASCLLDKKTNKLYIKIIVLITLIVGTNLIFKGQFAIAILLYIIFLVKILFEKLLRKRQVGYIIAIMALILLVIFLPLILEKIIESETISLEIKSKLIEIKEVVQGRYNNTEDLQSRMYLYNKSLKAFQNNILIGSFGKDIVGNHSTFLDFLGLYGLLSVILLTFFVNIYRYIKKQLGKKGRKILFNVWFYYLILSFINPVISAEVIVKLFILVTFLIENIYKDEVKNENTLDS